MMAVKDFRSWAETDGANLDLNELKKKHSDYFKEMLELQELFEKFKKIKLIILPFNSTAAQIFSKLKPLDQKALREKFEYFKVF